MLCSYLRPSLPHILPVRLLSSAASRVAAVKQHELLSDTLAFEDPRAFKVKSLGELLRALGVFRLCSFPVLVNNCGKVRLRFVRKASNIQTDIWHSIHSLHLLHFPLLLISVDVGGTHAPGKKGVFLAAEAHCVCPVCGWRKWGWNLAVDAEDEPAGTETHAGRADRGGPRRKHRVWLSLRSRWKAASKDTFNFHSVFLLLGSFTAAGQILAFTTL